MRSFKLFVLILMTAIFVFSCGQSPNTQNAKAPAANSAPAAPIANSNSGNTTQEISPAKRRAQVSAAIDDDAVIDLYTEKCMICHKDTGKGGKTTIEGKTIKAADLTSARIKAKSDDKLLSEIKDGIPDEGMPAFGGKLSDEEIKSIIQKIRTF